MGRDKKGGPGAATGSSAKDRHKRDRKGNVIDWTAPLPPGLNARPDKPKLNSKHKTYFEFIENKDKKKKLEIQFTEDRTPPPGFEFVPIGNPALTTACKELSREQGAMIFIVTSTYGRFSRTLSFHLNRVGHHIRQSIVEQARVSLGDVQGVVTESDLGAPEPIPERQEDINSQADAAIRDLFPRIPNTDRQMIIEHAFNKAKLKQKNGEPPVGLAQDINLSRRVQLAVLAHIRHNHTRYDQLLRETTYVNARKAVEPLCLDILVKWRGDEETGRDQLDEILCEVVVISDSESDGDDEDADDDDTDSSDTSVSGEVDRSAERPIPSADMAAPTAVEAPAPAEATRPRADSRPRAPYAHAGRKAKMARKDRRAAIMKAQRGFSRYQAARDKAWHQAIERQQQHDHNQHVRAATVMSIDGPNENRQAWRSPEPSYGNGLAGVANGMGESSHRQNPQYGDAWPIVGSRAVAPGAQQAHYQHLDLRDHLVRSIEPYSPDTPQFPSQFPTQFSERLHIKPEFGEDHTSRPRVEHAQFQHAGGRSYNEAPPTHGYQVVRQPDFITLTPRYETARAPAATISHQHGSIGAVVSSQPRPVQRAYTPIDLTGDNHPLPSAHRNSPATRLDRPVLRSETRPIWIEDNDVTFRPEDYPIPSVESRVPTRQVVANASHYAAEDHRAFTGERNYSSNPTFMDSQTVQQVETRRMPPVHVRSQDDDFVEIVRVSNKFPRQHDDRAPPEDPQRYELRSTAQPNYGPPSTVDAGPYHVSSTAPQFRRIERVVARVEEPVYYRDDGNYSGGFPVQRKERVVGIEYVPTSHSREARSYADLPPVSRYEGEQAMYRQDLPPPAPRAYVENGYPPRTDQPDDGIITIRRRV
ncbi:hypothetical protein B0T16DRAFT_80062 [Cercophora newfieldiana]|uniref:DUF2293 domain-containing protein n=1 Tax=Cercophora newfieldiana TaxID=92897 RepID=A0AA39YFA2_9PEZI|nr:hypothetical protein B0T16DRAFT_80062 [Cercophora newfieldiana]